MKTGISRVFIVCVFAIIGVIGAVKISSIGAAQNSSTSAPQHVASGNIEGTISNVLNVPGYTYVEVETANGKVWAAAPSVSVTAGDIVSFSTAMPMHDFYSKALKREFAVIYFVGRLVLDEGETTISEEAAAAHGLPGHHPNVEPVQEIRKAEGGYTIAEIHARREELNGETMRLRGQVTKFTANVLNTNWIRLRDGSTQDELLATTNAQVAVNDIVLIEGRLVLNRDLGQGYVIPAILEDAKIATK